MKVPVYNSSGSVVSEHELNAKVFGVKTTPELIQQAVVTEQANARQSIAHTKVRSEVRGGGKKPWKQKGTGRARHGSIRSPQWRGGGVIFGPRSDRNYSLRLNKKMKRKALLMTLSDKVANARLVVLDHMELTGKTKDWDKAMSAVWSTVKSKKKNPSALVMVPTIPPSLKRATKNVLKTEAIRTDSLNILTLLKHEYVVTTLDGVKALETWLTK